MKSLKLSKKVGDSTDANFPVDGEGRVYHVGIKRGEGFFIFIRVYLDR